MPCKLKLSDRRAGSPESGDSVVFIWLSHQPSLSLSLKIHSLLPNIRNNSNELSYFKSIKNYQKNQSWLKAIKRSHNWRNYLFCLIDWVKKNLFDAAAGSAAGRRAGRCRTRRRGSFVPSARLWRIESPWRLLITGPTVIRSYHLTCKVDSPREECVPVAACLIVRLHESITFFQFISEFVDFSI